MRSGILNLSVVFREASTCSAKAVTGWGITGHPLKKGPFQLPLTCVCVCEFIVRLNPPVSLFIERNSHVQSRGSFEIYQILKLRGMGPSSHRASSSDPSWFGFLTSYSSVCRMATASGGYAIVSVAAHNRSAARLLSAFPDAPQSPIQPVPSGSRLYPCRMRR